ncbi:hypothetical protein [Draconibacterium mangrovi]|uniref:hypothetical protein n=1 Tax=Draconibacterium mangrovi TaxID=2697469 RepID=UPI0013D57F50|nr:hypothetical protein [Draconibacterium mangrovi]
MKRILIVITLIAAFSVAMASTNAKVNTTKKSEVTVVADDNSVVINKEEDEKKKKTEKKATATKTSYKKATGCTDAQKKSCEASGKTCGDKKATAEKKSCCGGSK